LSGKIQKDAVVGINIDKDGSLKFYNVDELQLEE
jgi:hypothetical protein